jgi:hypothetical protein
MDYKILEIRWNSKGKAHKEWGLSQTKGRLKQNSGQPLFYPEKQENRLP